MCADDRFLAPLFRSGNVPPNQSVLFLLRHVVIAFGFTLDVPLENASIRIRCFLSSKQGPSYGTVASRFPQLTIEKFFVFTVIPRLFLLEFVGIRVF